MGLGWFALPLSNLVSHAASRSQIVAPGIWSKPVFRNVKEFAKDVIRVAYQKGLEGKKIKETPFAALGSFIPVLSGSMGTVHELGRVSAKAGLKRVRDLKKLVDTAANNVAKAIKASEKGQIVAKAGAPAAGAALGGLIGAAATPQDSSKARYALGGATLGLAGGVAGGARLAKVIGERAEGLKAYQPLLEMLRSKAQQATQHLDVPPRGKLAKRFAGLFFEK